MTTNTNTKTYKVRYYAKDGTACAFTFTTDRAFRRFRASSRMCTGIDLGRPFVNDLCAAAGRHESNPESNMSKHGGFSLNNLRSIQCIETGTRMLFGHIA